MLVAIGATAQTVLVVIVITQDHFDRIFAATEAHLFILCFVSSAYFVRVVCHVCFFINSFPCLHFCELASSDVFIIHYCRKFNTAFEVVVVVVVVIVVVSVCPLHILSTIGRLETVCSNV